MGFQLPDLPGGDGFAAALDHARAMSAALADQAFAGPSRYGRNDLTDAMQYALDGGKAMRAFLVMESARMLGAPALPAAVAGLAIECMHAYSLIHDDLPCMDDDDLRRGKPTVHRKWSEGLAVLAGDALQSMAFELLTDPDIFDPKPAQILSRRMAMAAGHRGMVGGQLRDIEAETTTAPQTVESIIAIQEGKTGALIEWSATAGAVLADRDMDPLASYGRALGLAFQIWDDVLDVEGDAAEMGKAAQKDADAGKATFVSLMGLDAAKGRAGDLVDQACDALAGYGAAADTLCQAARFTITRRK